MKKFAAIALMAAAAFAVTPAFAGDKDKDKSAAASECAFKKGDMIEAEISDMGAATFIKQAGRAQPGQPLP